jgi:biopolymer transport protein TolR
MAFGRLERTRAASPMSDINMTPLIDVMLVLLVIFMITAPLMSSSLKLDLPKTAGAGSSAAPVSLAVAVDASGQLFIGDEPATSAQLTERARQAARQNPLTEVQLRADQKVAYGQVAQLIGLIQDAGLSRVGFITSADAAAPAASR